MGYWSADLNKAGQWLQINFEEETGDKTQHTGKAFLAPPQWVTYTKFRLVQTVSNGRNTRKMMVWKYVMVDFFLEASFN